MVAILEHGSWPVGTLKDGSGTLTGHVCESNEDVLGGSDGTENSTFSLNAFKSTGVKMRLSCSSAVRDNDTVELVVICISHSREDADIGGDAAED